MIITTKAIVLQSIKYSDSSLILKLYTEDIGLKSFIVKGISPKSKKKGQMALFQPLTQIEATVYNKESKSLNFIKELKPDYIYQSIPYDVRKSSVLLFINELLLQAIKEEESNNALFNFIENSLRQYDAEDIPSPDFHLFFALELTRYLGFYPLTQNQKANSFFDLQEGRFVDAIPSHPYHLDQNQTQLFAELINHKGFQNNESHLTRDSRTELLDSIINYYRLHLSGLREFKTVEVLKTVFD